VTTGQLVFLLLIAVVFYLLIIAPQRRKMRQQQHMAAALSPGVEVMTTAGLYATVVEVGDDDVRLEVAPGVVQRYSKAAVLRVLTPADADDTPGDEHGHEPGDSASGGMSDGSGTGPGPSGGPAAPREP